MIYGSSKNYAFGEKAKLVYNWGDAPNRNLCSD